ncbi:MAG: hypothetical protein SNJ59_05310 [Aggregatilineales bacterium]
MAENPFLSQQDRERLERARALIKAQQYERAAEILRRVDHPIAAEWMGKLKERMAASAHAASSRNLFQQSSDDLYIYSPNAAAAPPTCPRCRHAVGAVLVDCDRRQSGQCPYRLTKQEAGSPVLFLIGLVWMMLAAAPLVLAIRDQALGPDDTGISLFTLLPPLLLMAFGMWVVWASSTIRLNGDRHGSWTHTRRPWLDKQELFYPTMVVQPHPVDLDVDLPISILAYRFLRNYNESERAHIHYVHDGAIVYLTLVGLSLYGALRFCVQRKVIMRASGRVKIHHELMFNSGPVQYMIGGALEDKLLAGFWKNQPVTNTIALNSLLHSAASRAGGKPHELVPRTVEAELAARGLAEKLGVVGSAALAIKFFFGDSVESTQSLNRALRPKRPPSVSEHELDEQTRIFALAYDAFEPQAKEILAELYQQVNEIIESTRPDSSSN